MYQLEILQSRSIRWKTLSLHTTLTKAQSAKDKFLSSYEDPDYYDGIYDSSQYLESIRIIKIEHFEQIEYHK